MAEQPWHELPARFAVALRPALSEVADEIIEAVRTVPAYARPLEGEFGAGVRAGVQEALRHFLAEIEAGGPVERSDVYTTLGRGEMRAGRTLDALLSAYRVGARVAWRQFVKLGVQSGFRPEKLYLLAEAIFAYIDVLSAESAAGYAQEQSVAVSEAQLQRRRLVRMLIRDPLDPASVQAAAADAAWELPRTLAVLVVAGARRGSAAMHLPPESIAETVGELSVVVLPDPEAPGRLGELEHAVTEQSLTAALGPSVDWPEAPISFARGRAALELAGSEPELVVARDRIGELMLRTDARLAGELAATRLAPLDELSPGSRGRLRETLSAWLAEQGRIAPTAARLGVHPQTARYRISRLRELFGASLDDPDERFWLDFALRVPR